MSERFVYKVLTGEQYNELLTGVFKGAPVDLVDGYIHMSTASQVEGTVSKHFAGQPGLYIAAVDLAELGDAVKWEVSRGGDLFPHLYGDLPLSAIAAHTRLEMLSEGSVRLPLVGVPRESTVI